MKKNDAKQKGYFIMIGEVFIEHVSTNHYILNQYIQINDNY